MKKTLIAALLAVPFAATAADSGFYVSGGLGFSILSEADDIADTINRTAISVGYFSSDTTYKRGSGIAKFGGGYKINQNFAVEANYYSIAAIDFETTTTGPSTTGTFSIDHDVLNLSVVAGIPVGNGGFFFGKLGSASVDTTVKLSGGLWIDQTRNSSKSSLSYGIGYEGKLSDRLGLAVEWEGFTGQNPIDKKDLNISAVTASLKYSF